MSDGADMDLSAHQQGYARFLGIARTGTIVVAVIAFLVVLIISR